MQKISAMYSAHTSYENRMVSAEPPNKKHQPPLNSISILNVASAFPPLTNSSRSGLQNVLSHRFFVQEYEYIFNGMTLK